MKLEPVKLTSAKSSSAEASDVVVMFEKITHIEAGTTAFGEKFTVVHLGADKVEVEESVEEVFRLIARSLHGVDEEPPEPSPELHEEPPLKPSNPEELMKLNLPKEE